MDIISTHEDNLDFIDLTEPSNTKLIEAELVKLDDMIDAPNKTMVVINTHNNKLMSNKLELQLELSKVKSLLGKIKFKQNNESRFKELKDMRVTIRGLKHLHDRQSKLALVASKKKEQYIKLIETIKEEADDYS